MVELKNYGQPLVVIPSSHLSKYWPHLILLNVDDRTTADAGHPWAHKQKSQHAIKLIVLFVVPRYFREVILIYGDNQNWTSIHLFSRDI
jgi:hypothetical protein